MRRFVKVALALSVLLGIWAQHSTAAEPSAAAVEHYEKGVAHKKNDETADALRELQAAITESPGYADAYWALGWVQVTAEDKDGACKSFNAFLGLAPDDPRGQQAEEAILRLGGSVSPSKARAGRAPDSAQAQDEAQGLPERTEPVGSGDSPVLIILLLASLPVCLYINYRLLKPKGYGVGVAALLTLLGILGLVIAALLESRRSSGIPLFCPGCGRMIDLPSHQQIPRHGVLVCPCGTVCRIENFKVVK